MRIVCIGGGPAGLYFGLLAKKAHPGHEVTVVERNRPWDTFGWGVVFSDATLANMRRADPETAAEIEQAFNHWDDIEVLIAGRRMRTTGHGFVGIGRRRLLNILQARAAALGVALVFEREAEGDADFPEADLIVAADGVNSRIRTRHAEAFRPDLELRPNRYIWLGTKRLYDAFTFDFRRTAHGWFQAHIYRYDSDTSTFIVETTERAFAAHGLGEMGQDEGIAFCEALFAETLGGARLLSNSRHLRGSAWLRFQRLTCGAWTLHNGRSHVALMGDAAHTAHFAIGSGTKLALEDAIGLAAALDRHGHARAALPAALAEYEAERKVEVARVQNAARNAMEWFEVAGDRYAEHLAPEQFMYSLLTRSQRISHENLRLRDRAWLEGYERWFAGRAGVAVPADARPVPPLHTPFRLRGCTLPNRIVMSPMAMYSAQDGLAEDFHLVHLGARALGGAGLVFAEMTCPSPEARITPGCLGLWTEAQAEALARIVRFVHARSPARFGIQLGHSGPKGSAHVPWERDGAPLDPGWPVSGASPVPWGPGWPVPRPLDRAGMDRIVAEFARAARLAAGTGADLLELHCAHGYLLSAFLSPLTNRRQDEYGGSHANRARFPLEVFRAVRAAWPADRPLSVRLSCHDWAPGGNTGEDAKVFAALFRDAGADIIDCSSGQVWREDAPVYGRMYQTPFADMIRNEVGIPTIAVGAITEADQVNSIIAAGRADLCAVARPHLSDPSWALHEAARTGLPGADWPVQYLSGRRQYETLLARAAAGEGR